MDERNGSRSYWRVLLCVSKLYLPFRKAKGIGTYNLSSYPGIASTASFFLNGTEPAFGSLFQIGCAYALGIAFAIIVCGPTSGGHFHPAVTICLAVWQGVCIVLYR
jgi:glycerol uptake facilitator-like aquaporin